MISCAKKSNTVVETGVHLNNITTITLKKTEPLFGRFVEKFRVSESGDLLVFSDRIQDRIFVYDREGNFINVIGERGKGPKGLISVHAFAITSNNEVYVFDLNQRLFKTFDLNGEVIKSVSFLDEAPFGPIPYEAHISNQKIITPIIESQFLLTPEKSRLLAQINLDGKVDSVFGSFDSFAEEDRHYTHFTNIAIDEEKDVVYTNLSTSPYIQAFDLSDFKKTEYFGIVSKSHSLPTKEIHPTLPVSEIKRRSVNQTSNVGLYVTDHFIIQHMQILTKEWIDLNDYSAKENILVLYDKETYEFSKEIPVEHTLGAVKNNQLYFIEDFNPDNYTIGVYEITNEKK